MPRRNKTPSSSRREYIPVETSMQKKRFTSKSAAESAIKELQKYHLDLVLHAYRSSIDGGWYLTSTAESSAH